MRDLPRSWKRLARFCENPAMRGQDAERAAHKALSEDMNRQVRKSFVEGLCRCDDTPPLDLPGQRTLPVPAIDPLEQAIASAYHLEKARTPAAPAADAALAAGLRTHIARMQRQADELYARDPAADARATATAFADALASLDLAALAAGLKAGRPAAAAPVLDAIDVDEDDLSQPQ